MPGRHNPLPWLMLIACSGRPSAGIDTTPAETPTPTPQATPDDLGPLTILQLDLPSRSIGESALILTPDGRTILIDVGDSPHDTTIRAALGARGITHIDHVVLTHPDRDHVGAFDELFEGDDAIGHGQVWRNDLTPPVEIELGEIRLTLFLADGQLATAGGVVDLWDTVDPDGSDNPRSIAGILTWGSFDYLFAGDLTGGGKDTPDVESAVAAQDVPWVPADGVDVLHVNHHGISSSTNPTWTAWLQPTVAVVGANNLYLDAPSPEALDALAPWVEAVWVTEDGLLGNRDARTSVAHGDVEIVVQRGGSFTVQGQPFQSR